MFQIIKCLFNTNKNTVRSDVLDEIKKIAENKSKEKDELFKSKGFDYDKLIKLIKEEVAESIVDNSTLGYVYLDDIFSEKLSIYELDKIVKYVNDFFGKRVARRGTSFYRRRNYIEIYINEIFDKI